MTGATGFIGRRLCSLLTENGHGITAIVRPSSANAGNLSSACRAIRADLSDRKRLATACADASAVIYCAGEVRGGNPEAFKAANVAGGKKLEATCVDGSHPRISGRFQMSRLANAWENCQGHGGVERIYYKTFKDTHAVVASICEDFLLVAGDGAQCGGRSGVLVRIRNRKY